jgi:hypothetical protein
MATMNMAGVNPAMMGAGGPVGGGMMMNNGSPAQLQQGQTSGNDLLKIQLNTHIYEYFLKLGCYDIARQLNSDDKFTFRKAPSLKQSPGRRKDGEVNGVDPDAMDTDLKDDYPDDIPRPAGDGNASSGMGFLFEWFSIFSDLYIAQSRSGKVPGGNPAANYIAQHQVGSSSP